MNNSNPLSVIPMVTEMTARGERAYDIFSLLLSNRIVFVGNEINDQTASLIVAQLLYLSKEDDEAPIQMYINSPGGVIYSGLAIYDTMKIIPNPISTLALGLTASFGTVLLAAGTHGQRYALPHATIHMHQPLGGAQGQASEIEIQANEILRLKTSLIDILASNTGKSAAAVRHDTERDFFMNAEQAVEYGLVDHVMEIPRKKNQ